ncbi:MULTISPECIES: ImmA/IrrE family metallo-endopeptidase [Leptospira]|uniref:ImmA/IrrE family metallo-endopeptidase n=1 Tax=Leptospira TaxID=171 RepID=UPI000774E337|nr:MULTISPECIES: ImmA/IrrE family metallo-endopeptidase [Leptospira]OMI18924.1 hypothetical protein BUQ74_01655 [Leptospira weilii serovar Heyan]
MKSSIHQLLQRKKVTVEHLADLLGFKVTEVYHLLDNLDFYPISILSKVAYGLDISLKELRDILYSNQDSGVLFRKSGAKVDGAFYRISRLITDIPPIDNESREPFWGLLEYYAESKNSHPSPKQFAEIFRSLFYNNKVIPLLDLPNLLTDQLKIFVSIVSSSVFEGASIIKNGVPFIFLSPRFSGRMLFTLAHELGHLLAHHSNEEILIDEDSFINIRSKDPKEIFANEFASELLLPENGITSALEVFRGFANNNGPIGDIEILFIARLYGVSFEVTGYRLEKLRMLRKGSTAALLETLKKNSVSPEKRADSIGLPPRNEFRVEKYPKFLFDEAIDAIRKGDYSIGYIAELLDLTVSELQIKNT